MNTDQNHTDSDCLRRIPMVFTGFVLSAGFFLLLSAGPLAGQDLEQSVDQPPVRLTSGFSLQTSFYSVSNIPYRRQPFNWNVSGTPVLHLYGVSLPFSFYLSNQQLAFQQPFNQFGVSPTYKWATAHLGYSSVRFSEYTLAGRRFLGGGTELNPGKFRFGFVYGRFQKAIEQDSQPQSTPEGYLSGVATGAFNRMGYALKLGYGTDDNYVDLLFLQAADDSSSLSNSLSLETLTPEKNSVLGIKHRFSIGELFWESDAAISFYTRSAGAEAVDSTDIAPILEPLYKLFDPKLSSQMLYAANTQVGYSGQNVQSSIRYRRISRDYKTMGAYYFQTDLEEIALQAGTSLFQRKMQVRGNIGFQRNNLSESRLHTTKRLIASLYTGAQVHRRLRLDATYSNFGISQRPQQPGLSDSLRIDQVQQSVQFSANYQIPSDLSQSVSLQFNLQDLAPGQNNISNMNEMRSITGTTIYTLSLPERQWTLSLQGQGIWQNQATGTIQSLGGGITASKVLFDGRLNTHAGGRFYQTSYLDLNASSTLTFDTRLNYNISSSWSVQMNLTYTSSDGSGQLPGQRFNENYITLGSQFNF